jgi:hypothetical protein
MPNKSNKSSRGPGKKTPAKTDKPKLADNSPQRLHMLKRLDESMNLFEATLDKISDSGWSFKPSAEQWSIAEIVHHLIMVEVQRLEVIKAMIAGKRESLPPREGAAPDIAAARTAPGKNQAPAEMQPTAGLPMKVLRAGIRRARMETRAFVEAVDLQKAGDAWLKTASLGVVNAAEYLEFLSAHMERHVDQIARIATQAK